MASCDLNTNPSKILSTNRKPNSTILYHGPVRTRAERLAKAAVESLELMAEVTGADTKTPIVMVLYNNNAEMIEAVVAKSLASSRELITEGQAFDSESVVLACHFSTRTALFSLGPNRFCVTLSVPYSESVVRLCHLHVTSPHALSIRRVWPVVSPHALLHSEKCGFAGRLWLCRPERFPKGSAQRIPSGKPDKRNTKYSSSSAK